MMYDLCSYNIHEDDLNMVKEVALSLNLKIKKLEGPFPLYKLVFSLNADKEHYYQVEFEDIETQSFHTGVEFEDDLWNILLTRSTDSECLKLLNT